MEAEGVSEIFHIASADLWGQAGQTYQGDTLESEGFIHCSTAEQVLTVANAIFRGRTDLVLLRIAAERVEPEIRYENLEGGSELFPHVYGSATLASAGERAWLESVATPA